MPSEVVMTHHLLIVILNGVQRAGMAAAIAQRSSGASHA